MITKIKTKYLYEVKEGEMQLGTLAFLLLLRFKMDDKNYIKGYSVNLVSKLTGVSWATCDKYMRILFERKIVYMNNSIMEMHRLSSGTKHRNTPIRGLDFSKLSIAKYTLHSLFLMLKTACKEKVRRSIQVVNDPKKHPSKKKKDDYKGSKAFCKKYVRPETNGTYKYHDFGMTFKTIAKVIGCCTKTAQKVVKYAMRKHYIIRRKLNYLRFFLPNINGRYYPGMTFTGKDHGYVVPANRYELPKKFPVYLMINGKPVSVLQVITF